MISEILLNISVSFETLPKYVPSYLRTYLGPLTADSPLFTVILLNDVVRTIRPTLGVRLMSTLQTGANKPNALSMVCFVNLNLNLFT